MTLTKLIGARVIASASSHEKREIALAAGADIAVDTQATDWRAQVEAVIGPRGVDVIYDPVGDDVADRAFRTLGYQGRCLVVGFAAGSIPKLALNLPLMKASSIIGVNLLRGWEAKPERIAANADYLIGLFGKGKLALPPIAKRYSLDCTGEAYYDVASGKTAGQVVVSILSAVV